MRTKPVRVIFNVALVALAALTVLAAGCQTVKGVGKDISNASEATERAISN